MVPNQAAAGADGAKSSASSAGVQEKANRTQGAIDALKHQVAIAAVAAYALSDTDGRVGSRQSRDQVEQLLKDTGLDEKMKIAGIWAEWQQGERGRQP